MEPKYDPAQLVHDANAFADSKFGAHYLARLEAAKDRSLKDAMNVTLTDSVRAHAGTTAATVQAELDYFQTARTVQESPKLMERLRQRFQGKEAPDIDV